MTRARSRRSTAGLGHAASLLVLGLICAATTAEALGQAEIGREARSGFAAMRAGYEAGHLVPVKEAAAKVLSLGRELPPALLDMARDTKRAQSRGAFDDGPTYDDAALARMILPEAVRRGGKDVVPDLLRMLRTNDHAQKLLAVDILSRLEDRRGIKALLEVIQAPPPKTDDAKLLSFHQDLRRRAAQSLAWNGHRAVVPVVVRHMLEKGGWLERLVAVRDVLGRVGGDQAIRGLLSALDDEDDKVQRAAIEALGKVGDERAVPPLLERVERPDAKGKIESIRALMALGAERDKLLGSIDRMILTEKSEFAVLQAVRLLPELGRESRLGLTALLTPALRNPNPGVREAAVTAAAGLGFKGQVAAIEKVLAEAGGPGQAELRLRLAAASALLRLTGKKLFLSILTERLTDQEGYVRYQAAEMIIRADRREGLSAIDRYLATETSSHYRREIERKVSVLSGEAETDLFRKGLAQARLEAAAIRSFIESLPEDSFRWSFLATLSRTTPSLRGRSGKDVQAAILALIDHEVLKVLDRFPTAPEHALAALTILFAGVYDHADGHLGGYAGDDLITDPKAQRKLGERVERLARCYSDRYAAARHVGPEGGSLSLAGGSRLELPAGALRMDVPIFLLGPHPLDAVQTWGYFPSGLTFHKKARLTMVHRPAPGMVRMMTGSRHQEIAEEDERKTVLLLDGFR